MTALHIVETGRGERRAFLAPSILFLFCLACRAPSFGNPLVGLDEGFYLFVGGQMLHGALPYVDIWDRKPIGLFLIYAFFHLFGPYRIWAYQIGAALCVWLTSVILMRMARKVAPPGGAFVSGLIYIASLNLANGEGGQSPVFYNLLVVLAMALILGVNGAGVPPARIRRAGRWAMALFGLALQINYMPVFEGCFAGLYLLWLLHRAGAGFGDCVREGAVWIGIALVPTALTMGFYAATGHLHEWWFANFVSIFRRGLRPRALVLHQARKLLLFAIPPLLCIPLRRILCGDVTAAENRDLRFIDLWAFAAAGGVAVFRGGWYTHYALPMFAPLSLLAAPLWRRKAGRAWGLALLCVAVVKGQFVVQKRQHRGDDAATFRAMLETVSRPPGCVFIYNGPVVLYDFIRYCPLTDHPFPGHFDEESERGATGMDVDRELSRILAARPLYIISREPPLPYEDLRARTEVHAVLDAAYRPVGRFIGRDKFIVIYRLRGGEPAAEQERSGEGIVSAPSAG